VEEQAGRVIIAGFGRFGHIVGLLFRSCGVFPTVLDLDPDHVEMLRRLGLKVFFGDASRLELLHSAGARDARLLVVAVDDEESSIRIIETAQKHFPHLQIFARASGRPHAYRLLKLGVNRIYRETLDSSLELGADALRGLGFRAYEAQRAARVFRRQDEATVRELAKHWATGTDSYLAAARQRIRMSQEAIAADRDGFHHVADAGWDTESLRAEFGAPAGPETPGDADPLTP
jgi:voltage-gated potassium channel Kch